MTLLTDMTAQLRLEVEDTATGLVNLARNPDGELGGWAYVTPLSSSTMAGDPINRRLTYTRTTSGASYFLTEPIPITAGQYAAASFLQASASNAHHKVSLEWLNASKALLSSSTLSSLIAPSATAKTTVGATVAPASTAYVRLRVDLFTSGGANPTGSHTFLFKNVTICTAATAGALTTVRTNLIPNPSFDTNVASWDNGLFNLSRVTTPAPFAGSGIMRAQALAAGSLAVQTSLLTGTTPGKLYTLSAYVRADTTARSVVVRINWRSAANADLGTSTGSAVTSATGSWTRASVTAEAPTGATQYRAQIVVASMAAAEYHYIDAVLFEQSAALGTYFDGSTTASGSLTYAWSGTAHASTSTETNTQLDFVPVPFTNVLGPTSDIKVTRPPLDVATLEAIVRNVALDPATATLLRPGKRVRLTARNSATGLHEALFTGKLSRARVEYDLLRKDEKQATIYLTGLDATREVANVTAATGVATIPELPFILEGAGIPWNCDGSANQVASATAVSYTETATVLDQVGLTRDSVNGYAWITKEGVLTAYTNRTLDYYGNGTAVLDEADYTDLVTSFDTDDCVNEVLVQYLRFNATTLETTEVTFGPYRDAASIAAWGGARQATYRVHGIAESAVPTFAAAILTANATPAFRVDQIRVPITDTADLVETKALIDQYAKVQILNTAKSINVTHRVGTIVHTIAPPDAPGRPVRWTMELDFSRESSIPGPVPTPTPGEGPTADGVWVAIGSGGSAPAFTNGWTNFGGAFATAAYMRKNGVVYLRGFVKSGTFGVPMFTLPAGYRPSAQRVFSATGDRPTTSGASTGTAHTHSTPAVGVRLDVLATGEVQVPVATTGAYNNTFQSLDGVSFPAEQ